MKINDVLFQQTKMGNSSSSEDSDNDWPVARQVKLGNSLVLIELMLKHFPFEAIFVKQKVKLRGPIIEVFKSFQWISLTKGEKRQSKYSFLFISFQLNSVIFGYIWSKIVYNEFGLYKFGFGFGKPNSSFKFGFGQTRISKK